MNRILVEIKARPVLTVTATILLKEIARGKSVFEFGSGGSTLWFSKFVKSLISVEDDPGFYEEVLAHLTDSPNVKLIFAETKVLPDAITNEGLFDVVFVDCMPQNERRRSVILGAQHVKPGGWLVADDYNFPMTNKEVEVLRSKDWDVAIVSGVKMHPIKNVPVKTSTAFCHKRES
jgi:predicted O-methyltransferase YrrM